MNAQPIDIAATESLLAFWRDAGVDACYGDAAVDRTYVEPPALEGRGQGNRFGGRAGRQRGRYR